MSEEDEERIRTKNTSDRDERRRRVKKTRIGKEKVTRRDHGQIG